MTNCFTYYRNPRYIKRLNEQKAGSIADNDSEGAFLAAVPFFVHSSNGQKSLMEISRLYDVHMISFREHVK